MVKGWEFKKVMPDTTAAHLVKARRGKREGVLDAAGWGPMSRSSRALSSSSRALAAASSSPICCRPTSLATAT